MNEKLARKLRSQVFGNFSIRDPNYTRDSNVSIRCVGRRAQYQRLKKDRRLKGTEPNLIKKRRMPKWLLPKNNG